MFSPILWRKQPNIKCGKFISSAKTVAIVLKKEHLLSGRKEGEEVRQNKKNEGEMAPD